MLIFSTSILRGIFINGVIAFIRLFRKLLAILTHREVTGVARWLFIHGRFGLCSIDYGLKLLLGFVVVDGWDLHW